MKKIEIYDPAMCCSTGVCGPGVDPELLRVATLIDSLSKNGADITRYNLSSDPQAFVSNKTVNQLLQEENDILPITLVDNEVVKTKSYPTTKEFSSYTGILIMVQPNINPTSCCAPKEPCCTEEEAKVTGCCQGEKEGGCC